MKKYHIGNVVEWNKRFYVVAKDDGNVVDLIPMNSSNSSTHPSKKWPSEDGGREAIVFIAETIYGWMIKSLVKKPFGIKGPLSADGWTPR